jgi:hypothetical protein
MFKRKKKTSLIMITVPEPCSEKWKHMREVDACHRHCAACDRVLTDFSVMSDNELMIFFHQNKGKVCGRFRNDQLNRALTPLPVRTAPAKWWKIAFLLPFSFFAKNAFAQTNEKDTVPTIQFDSSAAYASKPDSVGISDSLWNWSPLIGGAGEGYTYVGGTAMITPLCVTTGYTVVVEDCILPTTDAKAGAEENDPAVEQPAHPGRTAVRKLGKIITSHE